MTKYSQTYNSYVLFTHFKILPNTSVQLLAAVRTTQPVQWEISFMNWDFSFQLR